MATTKTIEQYFLNTQQDTKIYPELLRKYNLDKLTLLDEKHIEVVSNGETQIRTYYTTTKDVGHFYLNDVRYKVYSISTAIPSVDKIERKIPEKKEEPKPEQPKPKKVEEKPNNDGNKIKHAEYDTIKTCIESNIPVYIYGPAGSGKNHVLLDIANELGLDFYFTNSVQQEHKITGYSDAGGNFHPTEFYKAFRYGGLFFLDEMDASIPEVLVLLNAAIANKYFTFDDPIGRIDAHPDFRVVAAGNTLGSGANELYTGRLVLDSATLDRFPAKIEFDYDQRIELFIAKGNKELVNFIRSLRNFCDENGIRQTYSYRMISAVVGLESAGMALDKIIKIAVVSGLDKDTIRTLKVKDSGKYYHALEEVKKAL